MDPAEFKRWFKGSPVERIGRKRLLRNVAIAMGNSGEGRFLPWLEDWAVEEDAGAAGPYYRVWLHLKEKGLIGRGGDRAGLLAEAGKVLRRAERGLRRARLS